MKTNGLHLAFGPADCEVRTQIFALGLKNRPICVLAGCRKRRIYQPLSILSSILGSILF